MLVFEEMRRAVEAAAVERLGEVAAAVWQAYGAGGLTDAEAEQLDGLLNARRGAARAAPVRTPTLAVVAAQVVPAAAPAAGQGTAPARAHHRTGSRPRTAESTARRRRMAANGLLPPALAAAFTPGEQAVLAVVALEVGKRGKCTLALGNIAALAGVSERTVRRAFAQAKVYGLLSVEERRVSWNRNDTNLVRIVSREWGAWLRLRLPRSAPTAFPGGGRQSDPSTTTGISRGPYSGRPQAENRRSAAPNRTTRPATRAADA